MNLKSMQSDYTKWKILMMSTLNSFGLTRKTYLMISLEEKNKDDNDLFIIQLSVDNSKGNT